MNVAATAIARYSDHPSSYLALNEGTRHFTLAGTEGVIAYVNAGRRFAVQVGGVYVAEADREKFIKAFLSHTASEGRRVIAVQLRREDAALYKQFGFSVNQFGSSYSLTLPDHSLKGTRFMKLRNKISRASRAQIRVVEIGVDQEYSAEIEAHLNAIDRTWLRSKGKHVKQLRVLVGDRGSLTEAVPDRRIFVALRGDEPVGYISYRRTYGRRAGWMHDLSRRTPDETPGVLELCNSVAIERFRAEGSAYLHFGFTPFVGLSLENELRDAYSKAVGWVLRMLAKYGRMVYPAQSQLEYKLKWFPTQVEPEFIAFEGGFSFGGLMSLLKVTQAL